MKIINVNMSPRDGYIYRDTQGVIHTAESWKSLCQKVRKYRESNKLPMGDPELDVMSQACQRNSDLCHEGESFKFPPQDKNPKSAVKPRLLAWLNDWRKAVEERHERLVFVSQEEAAARAEVCARCDKNVLLPDGCSACRAALTGLRNVVIGSHRHVDKRLGGCEVIGSDLPAATHLDEIRIGEPALPANCWRKTQ